MSSSPITNKRILITGGTGSFGRIFIKELLRLKPKEIIVFSRGEDKQDAMKHSYHDNRLRFILGDVKDLRSIKAVVRGVHIIVHAAALKRIPEVELNVWEGIKSNIFGAQNIIEAAREANVEKVVALSTDKAVEPVNAYGLTKALQEKLMTTANLYDYGTKTIFVSVRYGNVLGSSGSVVPLFKSLIDAGKPLTITDPRMTRFLLTLQESVQLVLTSLKTGVGGEVFVPKVPAHTIGDLAEVMLENLPADKKKIKIIGIRPGEKIHESLISPIESIRTIKMKNYYIILPEIPISASDKKYGSRSRSKAFLYTSNTTRNLTKDELRKILKIEGWIK